MSNSKLFIIFFLFFFFTIFASSSTSFNNIHKCLKKQSEALLLFKQSLSSINYTEGFYGGHPIMMSWNTSIDCCNWDGVTCDNSTGDVIGLDVSGGLLSGTLHPNSSLFNLPRLQRLNLAFNDFTEQIPREIGRFSNSLTHLDLSHCEFYGEVPPDITLLHKLETLQLSGNTLTGDIRSDISVNLTHLTFLDLSQNKLNGTLPSWLFTLPSLETLILNNNMLSGNVPLQSFPLPFLTFLDLSGNKHNGTLPSWLFTFPSLETLILNDNMLSGNVRFALPSLKVLDLRHNQLAGHIDDQTFQQLTNLTHLRLSYNNFSGEWELDTLLSSLRNLYSLDLSYSGFFVTAKNANHYVNPGFFVLELASCKLKVFPESIRAMKQLEMLDLSSNEIHGQIPRWAGEIGGTYGLRYLNLSHNFITRVPQFQWYGLVSMYLQSNLIEGPFPTSICNMSDLWVLEMSNNRFGGLIPQCFGNITSSLTLINMGNNSFQGTIPSLYDGCQNLEGLILKGNQLEGAKFLL